MASDYKQLVRQHVLDEDVFVEAVFSGRRRGHEVPWKQVTIRPVLIRGQRCLKFSYVGDKQDITKNYTDQIEEKLDQLLELPFGSINLRTTRSSVQVQLTRKGKAILHRHRATELPKISFEHDRQKKLMLPANRPDPFLHAIGIMTRDGKVRARMRRKFQQINEFLKLVIETGNWQAYRRPLTVVDCGCGNAYLTFAVYHYLNHILDVPTRVTGLDVNRELIDKHVDQSRVLGWKDLTFRASAIIDFEPAEPPDIVLALHACDTATDEAFAQAVRWKSRMIFGVPCCHHHLQQQLRRDTVPASFRPVFHDGILKERLGDVLTDAFRAQILRILGYRTDVVQFISMEHTAKNLMIRANQQPAAPEGNAFTQEYEALKAVWEVQPYLADLLTDELTACCR